MSIVEDHDLYLQLHGQTFLYLCNLLRSSCTILGQFLHQKLASHFFQQKHQLHNLQSQNHHSYLQYVNLKYIHQQAIVMTEAHQFLNLQELDHQQ